MNLLTESVILLYILDDKNTVREHLFCYIDKTFARCTHTEPIKSFAIIKCCGSVKANLRSYSRCWDCCSYGFFCLLYL